MDHSLPVEILLVEDSATDLEVAPRALKKAKIGNRIEVARDGDEALDFVFARNAYAARSIDDEPRVSLLDESYDLGVNSYIVKPVDFERFSAAVAELGMSWMLQNLSPAGGP